MRKTRVIVVGLALFVVATATVGGFSLFGRSDDQGGRAFYFSVATKNATGAGCFQGGCFIAMFGSGTFEGTDAQGNGIFSISTGLPPSSTNSVASGTWEVTGLVSFTSYGVANLRPPLRRWVRRTRDAGDHLSRRESPANGERGRNPCGVEVQLRHTARGNHDVRHADRGLSAETGRRNPQQCAAGELVHVLEERESGQLDRLTMSWEHADGVDDVFEAQAMFHRFPRSC